MGNAAIEAKKAKPGRKTFASAKDEVAYLEQKLREARERAKKEEATRVEKNRKAIAELLRAERLDEVSIGAWKNAIDAIKQALSAKTSTDTK